MVAYRRFSIPVLALLLILLSIVGMSGCSTVERAEAQSDGDGHARHEESGGEEHGAIALTASEREEFGLELETAGPGTLFHQTDLPGEIRLDQNRLAHITPTVPGHAFRIEVQEGDDVVKDQLLAVIHSRELAEAKTAWLEARERQALARSTFERVNQLRAEGISSEEEYLATQRELRSAEISVTATEQTLHALGLPDRQIKTLEERTTEDLSHLELRSPIAGRVIQRTLVLGQRVNEDTDAFVVAALDSVWVDANVYPQDLPFVREGLKVSVLAGYGLPTVEGRIAFVGPVVGENTRTATARVVIPNPDGLLRPGLFVTVEVDVDQVDVPVAVPHGAVVQLEGEPHVFIVDADGLEPVKVMTGMRDSRSVEILEGLKPGDRYVATNGFVLKAELEKGAFGGGHGH